MYSFANDYSEGAHPAILEALQKTNHVQSVGYGLDEYCQQASDLLKTIMGREDVDIHYLVGGTQTNMIFISSVLRPYQAVMCVDSGHINVHETGAIESTGHKVLTRQHKDGKITVEMIQSILDEHTDEHMVQPKMVYLSQTTEYGTYYTLEQLKEISRFCHQHDVYLFLDGARLGSALPLPHAPSIKDLATYCDAFYIGGTKMGALFGESLVIVNPVLKKDFRYHLKQKGAMLAKGRLLGVQFKELFSNDLYLEIGKHENQCADILRQGIKECGYSMYIDSPSNQLFPIFPNMILNQLSQKYILTYMFDLDQEHTCVRLVTSWATSISICEQFIKDLRNMKME